MQDSLEKSHVRYRYIGIPQEEQRKKRSKPWMRSQQLIHGDRIVAAMWWDIIPVCMMYISDKQRDSGEVDGRIEGNIANKEK